MESNNQVARALNELCSSRLSSEDQESLQNFVTDYFCPVEGTPSKYEYQPINEY